MNQKQTKTIVGVVAGILVAAVLIGSLLPTAIGFVNQPQDQTATLTEGNTSEVTPELVLKVTTIDTTAGDVTFEYQNANGTVLATDTLAEGNNATYSLEGGEVTTNVDSITNATTNEATLTTTYPADYGWGAGASALYGLMPLLFVLIPFLGLIAWVYKVM